MAGGLVCWVLGPTPPAQFGLDGAAKVWSRRRWAGGGGAEEWPLATFHNETALGGWGQRYYQAGRVGPALVPGWASAVVADKEASSNKIGL